MAQVVEFIGGPADGHKMRIENFTNVFLVPPGPITTQIIPANPAEPHYKYERRIIGGDYKYKFVKYIHG